MAAGQQHGPTGRFPFQILGVNRGDCVAGIPAVPSIPSEVGFTPPRPRMLERAWQEPFDNICLFSAGGGLQIMWPRFFLAAEHLVVVLGGGLVSPGRWEGLWKGGARGEANHS